MFVVVFTSRKPAFLCAVAMWCRTVAWRSRSAPAYACSSGSPPTPPALPSTAAAEEFAPPRPPAEQIQWLLDRAPTAGFGIAPRSEQDHRPHVTVASHQVLDFARAPGGQRGRNVHIHSVTYEGQLHVTDPDALRHTLTQGIGRAKGYGCGLLTLAPAPHPD